MARRITIDQFASSIHDILEKYGDEINENMPLEISSDPDSVIRVIMTFKGLDAPINVKEQKLTPAERTGFTVVEWGGTELK